MNVRKARKIVRKERRKNILIWYRFLKAQMKQPHYIEKGFYLGTSYFGLPNFGYNEGARLLCFKDKNFTIQKVNNIRDLLIWKFIKL